MESQAQDETSKLAALRRLAAEGYDALERGNATEFEGEEELGAFISRIGKRVAERVDRRSSIK
jgi:hypothetical protein